MKDPKDDLKKMRKELESRSIKNPPNDFWYNGKLFSEMTEKEIEELRKLFWEEVNSEI